MIHKKSRDFVADTGIFFRKVVCSRYDAHSVTCLGFGAMWSLNYIFVDYLTALFSIDTIYGRMTELEKEEEGSGRGQFAYAWSC
jgi:hypothetical protein